MLYAILFVVFIVGTTAVLSWPLGRHMKWAMDPEAPNAGAAGWFTRAFQFFGGSIVRARAGLEAVHDLHAHLQRDNVRGELQHHGHAAIPAAQPRWKGGTRRKPDLQHSGLVHLQYQPSALFRRSVDELPVAAWRADVATIRVGSNRHCCAWRRWRVDWLDEGTSAISSWTCSGRRSSCSCQLLSSSPC